MLQEEKLGGEEMVGEGKKGQDIAINGNGKEEEEKKESEDEDDVKAYLNEDGA